MTVLAAVLLVGACSERPSTPRSQAVADPSRVALVEASTIVDSPPASDAGPSVGPGSAAEAVSAAPPPHRPGAPTPEAAAPAPPAARASGLPLAVTVVPSCVSPGELVEVHVTSGPRAGFVFAIAFADDQTHGAMGVGDADDAGAFIWRVVVAPGAPSGEARVLVAAKDGAGSAEQAHGRAPFDVAPHGGCP